MYLGMVTLKEAVEEVVTCSELSWSFHWWLMALPLV